METTATQAQSSVMVPLEVECEQILVSTDTNCRTLGTLGYPFIRFWKPRSGSSARWVLHLSRGVKVEKQGGTPLYHRVVLLAASDALSKGRAGNNQAWRDWVSHHQTSSGLWSQPQVSQSAMDHRRWLGSLPRKLVKNGYVRFEGAVPNDLLQQLLQQHCSLHMSPANGWAIHHRNGIRGINLYLPGRAKDDAYCRRKGGYVELAAGSAEEGIWVRLLELVASLAGRTELPDDIDCMCSWPSGTPQEWHQDGTFSILAASVHLSAGTGTLFLDYEGKEFMMMGQDQRGAYIADKFAGATTGRYQQAPSFGVRPGDIIFFHTGHLHCAPAPPAAHTSGCSGPRRTIFLGFVSDCKVCNSDVIRASNCDATWERFHNTTRDQRQQESRREWVGRWGSKKQSALLKKQSKKQKRA